MYLEGQSEGSVRAVVAFNKWKLCYYEKHSKKDDMRELCGMRQCLWATVEMIIYFQELEAIRTGAVLNYSH
jgi:hypothetical protein